MKIIGLCFFLTILNIGSFCQYNNIRFKTLDISQGLSSNNVNAILKDSRGFMWFGTHSGLNRYDGYTYKVYNPVPLDSNSVSNSFINALAEDKDLNIWIGTIDGLNRFNPKTEKFTRFYPVPLKNSLSNNYISDLYVDEEGIIWIGLSNGINVYNPKSGLFKAFDKTDIPDDAIHDYISDISGDHAGNIYILTKNGFFYRFVKQSGQFHSLKKLTHDLPYSKKEQVFCVNDTMVWLGFSGHIYIYNPVKSIMKKLIINSNDFKVAANCFCKDISSNLWVGSTNKGLFIFNHTGSSLLAEIDQEGKKSRSSLTGIGINRLYCDRDGIVWIATIDGGINFYHKDISRFQTINTDFRPPLYLSDNRVNAIFQASSGNIYIGTEKGLDVMNSSCNSSQHVGSVKESPVLDILQDSKGKIWVSTYDGKIYNGKGSDFSTISLKGNFKQEYSVKSMFEDKEGNIWLGTINSGVIVVDDYRISNITGIINAISPGFCVNAILQDSEENIWIATTNGILKYSNEQNYKSYTSVGNRKLFNVNSIYQDRQKRLWFGFNEGLLLYDYSRDTFNYFNNSNGLLRNWILGIAEDDYGYLWLLSSDGLLRIDTHHMDANHLAVSMFNEDDGLPDNLFRLNAICKTNSGLLITGSPNGIGIIDPGKIDLRMDKPEVQLTRLMLFNETVPVSKEINKRILLDKSITYAESITLSHNENVFSIEFSALPYLHPEKCKYRYRLKGLNDSWIITDSRMRSATYTNLHSGKYLFCVQASMDGENWGPENQLSIEVLPPFWRSNSAKMLYAIITLLFLFLLRYVIRTNERNKIKIKQEQEEARRVHKLDMMKINLFTNISHEFRTPLTLIISPLEKLLSEGRYKDLEKPFHTMQRNSQRLLHLINQLLDFRKLEACELEFSPSTGDIIFFTRNIAMSFNDIAESKGMKYVFNSNVKELIMQFDHDKYDKIIYNLLSNAFKYTPERGTVALEINFTEEVDIKSGSFTNIETHKKGELVVKVKDTGIGIPADLQNHIFKRFVQAGSLEGSFEKGSGIGLSLVHEYVKCHGGTIRVESKENNGSCFMLTLPVIRSRDYKKETSNPPNVIEELTEVIHTDYEENEYTSTSSSSILIVEDNEELRFYLKDNLRKNYRIYEAKNGETGFQLAKEKLPDIIITDILMPVSDGISLCKQIKNEHSTSHIPVIMLTAMNADTYKIEGIEAGADDYIVKPFNFKILEARINVLMKNREKAQQNTLHHITVEPKDIEVISLDEQFIQKAFDIVEKNIGNHEFNVEEFSKCMAMSRMVLYKKLMALTGKAPLEFLRTMRLKRAAQLLLKSQLNIAEIALQVGFNDSKYFGQCFKNEFTMLPTEYRNRNTRNDR